MQPIDIVIPVYNEGDNIVPVLEALREGVLTPFRVLICYDFDEDNTLEALAGYDPPLEIVLVKNPGRGAHRAVMEGFKASASDYVLVFPADDTYNAPMLDRLFEKARGENCEIVCASRFMKGGAMVGCPPLKAFFVRCSAFTLYHFARIPTHDASNGFRLFSRRVIEEIEVESSQGFTYSIELLVKAHRLGWKIGEVPALWFERGLGQGASNFHVLKWLRAYLRWYFYAFATSYLRRDPDTVPRRSAV